MIAWVVITTGTRLDYLERTLSSAVEHVHGDVRFRLIYEDSGNPEIGVDLTGRWGRHQFSVWSDPRGPQGYDGAIRTIFERVRLLGPEFRHVFWLEDDFTFEQDVDLDDLAAVLDAEPRLAQLVLLRQPVNHLEREAGGIIEKDPVDYTEMALTRGPRSFRWVAHRRNFSMNPTLIPRWVFDRDWPEGEHSEGRFGIGLFADRPDVHVGYWGKIGDPPVVTHIGDVPAIGAMR